MSKCLVTGADGFIGSHLVEELLRQGQEVKAFVWYNALGSRGWLNQLPPELAGGLEVIAGDIRDPQLARAAVRGCKTVYHLAALIGIPYSYQAPHSYVETNVNGTLNLLSASSELGVERFVHTSTSEVYGTAQVVPITESHPLHAQSPYAASKVGADQLALSFWHSFGLPVIVMRPFNTYGPRQSARAVIPTLITQLLTTNDNTPIRFGSVAPTRDFTFVSDTVRGFVAAGKSKAGVGEVIQLGTNHEISMKDLAELIAQTTGRPLKIQFDSERLRPESSEVMRLCASYDKARSLLGWEPSLSGREGLKRGISLTLEWFSKKENLAFYRPETYQR